MVRLDFHCDPHNNLRIQADGQQLHKLPVRELVYEAVFLQKGDRVVVPSDVGHSVRQAILFWLNATGQQGRFEIDQTSLTAAAIQCLWSISSSTYWSLMRNEHMEQQGAGMEPPPPSTPPRGGHGRQYKDSLQLARSVRQTPNDTEWWYGGQGGLTTPVPRVPHALLDEPSQQRPTQGQLDEWLAWKSPSATYPTSRGGGGGGVGASWAAGTGGSWGPKPQTPLGTPPYTRSAGAGGRGRAAGTGGRGDFGPKPSSASTPPQRKWGRTRPYVRYYRDKNGRLLDFVDQQYVEGGDAHPPGYRTTGMKGRGAYGSTGPTQRLPRFPKEDVDDTTYYRNQQREYVLREHEGARELDDRPYSQQYDRQQNRRTSNSLSPARQGQKKDKKEKKKKEKKKKKDKKGKDKDNKKDKKEKKEKKGVIDQQYQKDKKGGIDQHNDHQEGRGTRGGTDSLETGLAAQDVAGRRTSTSRFDSDPGLAPQDTAGRRVSASRFDSNSGLAPQDVTGRRISASRFDSNLGLAPQDAAGRQKSASRFDSDSDLPATDSLLSPSPPRAGNFGYVGATNESEPLALRPRPKQEGEEVKSGVKAAEKLKATSTGGTAGEESTLAGSSGTTGATDSKAGGEDLVAAVAGSTFGAKTKASAGGLASVAASSQAEDKKASAGGLASEVASSQVEDKKTTISKRFAHQGLHSKAIEFQHQYPSRCGLLFGTGRRIHFKPNLEQSISFLRVQ
eukprot:gene14901-20949_t